MKYTFRGLTFNSIFLQESDFGVGCTLTPENGDDMAVISKLMEGCTVHASSTDILPAIKNVIFNNPATVVLWDDGTKTVVKCQDGDTYSRETGLALCMAKKAMSNNSRQFNDIFKKWIPEEKEESSCVTECSNCKHRDLPVDKSPCCECKMTKWEPVK